MFLSVLISTWNNSDRLNTTLAAIEQCAIPNSLDWELIVVDNNSTDHTGEVIAAWMHRLPLVAVFEPKQGLSHGRNAGLSKAAGKWILFTDDDVIPPKDWISEYLTAFGDFSDDFFFGGPIKSIFEGSPPPQELLPYTTKAVRGFKLNYETPTVVKSSFLAANWAAPSAAIQRARGFDPNRGLNPASGEIRFGEETDLQKRLCHLGLRPVYLPGAGLGHVVPALKSEPEYVIARAEAIARDAARNASRPDIFFFLRLSITTSLYWLFFKLAKAQNRNGWVEERNWRIRRGRLKGSLDRLLSKRDSPSR